jgi:PhoH-like ATPase
LEIEGGYVQNQYLLLKVGDREAYGRYDAKEGCFKPLRIEQDAPIWGIAAMNAQQVFALDALLDESVRLVTLVGKAGTGKTLLALVAGLQKCIDDLCYKRMLVSRPIMPLGRDIGFLPGSKDEKLSHWMQPVFDNLNFIFDNSVTEGSPNEQLEFLMRNEKISLEALTYIRGRSIAHQWLIVDEAQNLTPHEVKTIVSRAGKGTKIILTGDPYQIDNPYLDPSSNGLTVVVERFKGQRIFSNVVLKTSERSHLSSLAVELL